MPDEGTFRVIKTSVTNAYIIKGANGYLLIDTGYEKDYDNFLKQVEHSGINLKDITHLLLTHHHDDHCGFVNRLIEDTT